MQIPGGGGIRDNIIRHNNFDLNVPTTTSCIMMSDAINITIENNRLHGGSYIIYFEGNTTGCTGHRQSLPRAHFWLHRR